MDLEVKCPACKFSSVSILLHYEQWNNKDFFGVSFIYSKLSLEYFDAEEVWGFSGIS